MIAETNNSDLGAKRRSSTVDERGLHVFGETPPGEKIPFKRTRTRHRRIEKLNAQKKSANNAREYYTQKKNVGDLSNSFFFCVVRSTERNFEELTPVIKEIRDFVRGGSPVQSGPTLRVRDRTADLSPKWTGLDRTQPSALFSHYRNLNTSKRV